MTPTILTNQIITAYCACTAVCCPSSSNGLTAAGVKPTPNYTIAAPRNVPLGSKVVVDGIPTTFIAQDRLHKKYTNRWDVFFPTHDAARKFGIRRGVTITIYPPTATRK